MTVAEQWVVGYIIEFADGGPLERVIVRECDELAAERTARALEEIGGVPYEGDRPVVQGVVFTCAASSLVDEEPDGGTDPATAMEGLVMDDPA